MTMRMGDTVFLPPAAERGPSVWALRLQQMSAYASPAVVVLALIGAVGWFVGMPALGTLGTEFVPFMPTSIVKLLFIAFALRELDRAPSARACFTVPLAALAVALMSVMALTLGPDPVGMVLSPLLPTAEPGSIYSPSGPALGTATTYFLLAAALALAPLSDDHRLVAVSRLLAVAVGGIALVAVVGLTFHLVRLNLAIPSVGIALPVALALMITSFSLLLRNPPLRFMQLLEHDSPGAVIFRRLLPVAVAVPLLAGWLQALGQRFGWFGVIESEGVVAVAMIVACTVLILWTAARLDEMNTDRSIAELRANTQQQWLEVTLTTIEDAVITVNDEMRVGFLNPAAETLLDVKVGDAIGRDLQELVVLIDEATDQAMGSPFARAFSELRRATISGEPALRLRDGSVRAVEATATPIRDWKGGISGGVLVLRDARAHRAREHADRQAYAALDRRVGDRTRALERTMTVLRESTTLLSTIAASTPELIVAKSREGRIMMVNPAALQAMGLSRAQVVGHKEETLFGDSEEMRRILENDRRVIETRRPIVVEETRTTRAGTRTFLVTKSPLRDSQGHVFGLVGVSKDITERKRAQRELEQLLVAEHRLRGEAERANRAKDEFLAIVSHELRSPLNALKGWSQVLTASSNLEPATVLRAAEAIKRNINHQARLIDDLLDTSRIISGKLELNCRRVNLVDIVHAAIDLSWDTAKAKRIELRVHTDCPVMTINGDHDRLQQIVINLLANALKFTPEDGWIELRLTQGETSVILAVADSGVGIEADFLPHVFDRFSQADTSMTRRHQGLGIGLALVRNLVELHGGSVRVESAGAGCGSVFTVELPGPVQDILQSESPEAREGRPPRTALEGVEALVVDDEADAREVMTLILSQAGARVRTFSSGAELLAELARPNAVSLPAILLLDIAMPGDSGFSVLQRVRELASLPFIPAVAVTALSRLDRTRFELAGFQECVGKPIEARILIETIAATLDVADREAQRPQASAA